MTESTDTTEAPEVQDVEATEAVETPTETEAPEAREPREPVIIDRPIQTVGRRKEAVVRVRLVPGAALSAPGGLQLLEASGRLEADPLRPLLVSAVDDPAAARRVAGAVLSHYPLEHPAVVLRPVQAALEAEVTTTARFDPDRHSAVGAFLYLSAATAETARGSPSALRQIVHRLRAPGGCPWDREQTHATLKPFLLEETYEVLTALDDGDPARLREEFGDLLLQMTLHTEIAEEAGEFTYGDVFEAITTKLLRRHPHVFAGADIKTSDEQWKAWQSIKRAEKGDLLPVWLLVAW